MPCGNSSFERPRNRWNRATSFRLPIKACRRPANLNGSVHFLIRFKDIVSNHEHGRVNLQSSQKFKEQTDCIDYRLKLPSLKGKSSFRRIIFVASLNYSVRRGGSEALKDASRETVHGRLARLLRGEDFVVFEESLLCLALLLVAFLHFLVGSLTPAEGAAANAQREQT
jgi:hypothetical protein